MKKEPWPAEGIIQQSHISDYHWGYLTTTDEGQFTFEPELIIPPTETAIMARWGYYLTAPAKSE